MYMRTVSFDIDSAMIEQFRGEADGAREKFAPIVGLQHQYTGVGTNGNCLSVTIWESAEAAEKGYGQAMAVLQGLSRYLQGAPQLTDYPLAEIGK